VNFPTLVFLVSSYDSSSVEPPNFVPLTLFNHAAISGLAPLGSLPFPAAAIRAGEEIRGHGLLV